MDDCQMLGYFYWGAVLATLSKLVKPTCSSTGKTQPLQITSESEGSAPGIRTTEAVNVRLREH